MIVAPQARKRRPAPIKLRRGGGFGAAAALGCAIALSGCASLPVSGPTGNEVIRQTVDPKLALPFKLVELTDVSTAPLPLPLPPVVNSTLPPPATDLIGPDDILDIQIYEVGVALFATGSARSATGDQGASMATGAQAEHLPPVRVDDGGFIRLPYAGRLRAAGHTPAELSQMIGKSLHGLSQDPQVVVTIAQTIASSVIVGGEVTKPGRLVLATNRETLSDAIALAGGYRGEAKDLAVRIVRGDVALEYRLSDVLSGPARDLRVSPGDRLEVVRQPQTFAAMGAPGKVEQFVFPAGDVSLAEAVATAGGASPYFGDAKAIFVFRFIKDDSGKEVPTVYHLNMMHPGAYFVSQRFAMRDKDLLYVGNAGSNQPSKLIQLISQLFSPVIAVESTLVNTGAVK